MPTATKRSRKAQGVGRPSKVAAAQQHASSPSSINSFARVSKSIGNNSSNSLKKEPITNFSVTPQKKHTSSSTTKVSEATTLASRKRKAATPSEDDDSSADERQTRSTRRAPIARNTTSTTPSKPTTVAPAAAPAPTPVKRGRGRPSKKARPEPQPASRKRGRSPSVSDSEKSTADAGILLKRLRIEESCPPSSAYSSALSASSRCSSPPTADTSIAGSDDEDSSRTRRNSDRNGAPRRSQELPDDLLNLVGLHTALLKTLTLHYAHNGGHAPADLRVVCPNVARAWGKKKVTEADVRLCIGVLDATPSGTTITTTITTTATKTNPFVLSDYGRGKICIETENSRVGTAPGPLDESRLNGLFRANLTALWTRYQARGAPSSSAPAGDATAFLATLPRAPVALCASVAKASPVLSKGQRRLEELRQGIALKKQGQQTSNTVSPSTNGSPLNGKGKAIAGSNSSNTDVPMTNADGTKMSLLDRIRHKAAQKAAGGGATTGLSPAQLARRAALQRAPDIAAVADMLGRASGAGGRVSFTMAALLEKLRDSLRGGAPPRDEAAACLRIIAADVAPEWLRVLALPGRPGENVVLDMDRAPSRPEVERRVRDLLARGD